MANDIFDDVFDEIVAVARSITGIKHAPEHPLEALNEYPIAVTYLVSGRPKYSLASPTITVSVANCDIHLARSMLPHDADRARKFITLGLAAFAGNMTMSGTCEHCLVTAFHFGELNYGEGAGAQKTVGVRFVLEIKINHGNAITVAA